ncbi:hypothetical protein, partial [Akkermansia muciniphila]|uniref:hypothetical protein n=2 Tax=Akkermansia muciniphila TaxID=239935 RepID=UPI001EE7BDC0
HPPGAPGASLFYGNVSIPEVPFSRMGQTWRRKDFKSLPALGTTTLRTFSRLQGLYLLHHGSLRLFRLGGQKRAR